MDNSKTESLPTLNLFSIISRNLLSRWKIALLNFCGIALCGMLITGALVIGDSVKHSLRHISQQNHGIINFKVDRDGKFFRESLAEEFRGEKLLASSIISIKGTAIASKEETLSHRVHIHAVDDFFPSLFPKEIFDLPQKGEVVINSQLAARLGVKTDDDLLLQFPKVSIFSRETFLGSRDERIEYLRLKVKSIATREQFGNFNLKVSHTSQPNAFISLPQLQKVLEQQGKVNALLLNANKSSHVDQRMRENIKLGDFGILTTEHQQGSLDIRSDEIFIPPLVEKLIQDKFENVKSLFTYFVNKIEHGAKSTPYSTVTAISSNWDEGARELKENEIWLSNWLKRDLNAIQGSAIELSYFTLDRKQKLKEVQASFKYTRAVEDVWHKNHSALSPRFPGISDSENCRDWDSGLPFELERIRDKDEKYWQDFATTPKAFIHLEQAKRIWRNRFGQSTLLRIPIMENRANTEQMILSAITPASLGWRNIPLGELAEQAADQSMDFSHLFLSFAFFLILSALVLSSLWYETDLKARSEEFGILKALGHPVSRLRAWFMGEIIFISLLAAITGAILAWPYAQGILWLLQNSWQGAIPHTPLWIELQASTLIMGFALTLVISIWRLYWCLKRELHKNSVLLLMGTESEEVSPSRNKKVIVRPWMGTIGLAISVVMALLLLVLGYRNSLTFFAIASLFLLSGLTFIHSKFKSLSSTTWKLTTLGICIRNINRHPRRSFVNVLAMACGVFLVFSAGSHRLITPDANQVPSGTGAYQWIADFHTPIVGDLNDKETREHYDIDAHSVEQVDFLPLRVRDGDDASCLNLNHAFSPTLFGVPQRHIKAIERFRFAHLPKNWKWHDFETSSNDIPAIVDEATLLWSLKMKVGDHLEYRDESGRPFRIKFVATLKDSIFQGALIIAEKHLLDKYPSTEAYARVLVDHPTQFKRSALKELQTSLSSEGMNLTSTHDRMLELQQVQNTYITVFELLGGMGMLLAMLGFTVLILKAKKERGSELATLYALGKNEGWISRMLLSENLVLMNLGIGLGITSAVLALAPKIRYLPEDVPVVQLLSYFAFIYLGGLIAICMSLRKSIPNLAIQLKAD